MDTLKKFEHIYVFINALQGCKKGIFPLARKKTNPIPLRNRLDKTEKLLSIGDIGHSHFAVGNRYFKVLQIVVPSFPPPTQCGLFSLQRV
jgi:hypothetical protein